MKLRKINKVLFTTLLFCSVIVFSTFPVTTSKYVKDEDLSYNIKFKALYNDSKIKITKLDESSTYKKVVYEFSFDRSGNALANEENSYKIVEKKDKCSVKSISAPGSKSATKSGNTAIVTYTNGNITDANKTITVLYECNVSDITSGNVMISEVDIFESFKELDTNYRLYRTARFDKSVSEYDSFRHAPKVEISDDYKSATFPMENVDDYYAELKGFVKDAYIANVITNDEYKAAAESYFYSKYPNNGTINKTNMFNISLDGIDVTHNTTDNTYTFTVNDNYVDYALTYFNDGNSFYFSKDNYNGTANDLFAYYLDKYKYPSTSQQYTDIMNYVLSFEGSDGSKGINALLTGQVASIPGLTLNGDNISIKVGNILSTVYKSGTINLDINQSARDNTVELYSQLTADNSINNVGYDLSSFRDDFRSKISTIQTAIDTAILTANYDQTIALTNTSGETAILRIYNDGTNINAQVVKVDTGISYNMDFYNGLTSTQAVLSTIDSGVASGLTEAMFTTEGIYTVDGKQVTISIDGTKTNIKFTK